VKVFAAGVVLAIAMFSCPAFADGSFPWKAGDKPPAVAKIALGDTEQHARDVLGMPETARMGAGNVLEYPARGLQVIATKADGVSIIRMQMPTAGSIDGIKVGDDVKAVLAKWGPPHAGQDRTALYNAGVWTVAVRLADKNSKVVDISLAWNTTKWPNEDMSKAQAYRPQ
jgi:hypothetical protein